MTSYQKLEKLFKQIDDLETAVKTLAWDSAVVMPSGGSHSRSEALATLKVMIHEKLSSQQLADEVRAVCEMKTLEPWQQANFHEMERVWKMANSVEVGLIEAKSLAGSKCEHAWRELRVQNNWKDFLPLFEEVIHLTRQEALQRSEATGLAPYDAMMDLYEPGQRSANITPLFEQLKQTLPELLQTVLDQQKSRKTSFPKGQFSVESQKQLGLEVMKALGFDFKHGRLDISAHPFCGGNSQDTRITTRYDESDFTQSLMGVIHETGHACYEQGLPEKWFGQPVGLARSMGIHESQSLLYEMQVGRSLEFLQYVAPLMKKYFSPNNDIKDQVWQPQNLLEIYTRVKPGFIRVDADEICYPMHVILRYEIEKSLMEDKMKAADLPEVWDQKMTAYLGLTTQDNFKDGCMQDIHWTDGSFGYFPTYTLGAMNAAQIFNKAQMQLPDLMESISQGDFSQLKSWLKEKLWAQGSFFKINELMVHVTGESLNSDYFLNHLKARYLDSKG